MIKAITISLVCAALLALELTAAAQGSANDMAVKRALLNQQDGGTATS